jgi:multiple sugar transport system ATP-binding protein
MASITFTDVTKSYDGEHAAVDDLTLDIGDGEFVVLVGPSGCGKTTALRMIAGLETPTAGTIQIGDRVVNDVEPKNRDIAMVFQNYALYPHMDVEDNMAFGLRLRGIQGEERRQRVKRAAAMLGLEDLLDRRPRQLSGGQRQRVAMGRAIVREPQAFLMDEPLSNLDAKLRVSMRGSLLRLRERLGVTTVYVTHDQVEAMTLGDRVAVLQDGRLQQVDTPQRLFDEPCNVFVAGFIGSPAMNLVWADLVREGGLALRFGGHILPLPTAVVERRPGLAAYVARQVIAGIRPSDFRGTNGDDGALARMHVTVDVTESLGTELNALFTIDARSARHEALSIDPAEDEAALGVRGERSVWTATLNPDAPVRAGEPVTLTVDLRRCQLFDPDTGQAIV